MGPWWLHEWLLRAKIIDGPGGGSNWIIVHNELEARQAVHTAQSEGADFVKVYSRLSREEFFAIADESRKLGLTFSGHVPISISVAEASDAGMKSMEHLLGINWAFSDREDEVIKLFLAASQPGANADNLRRARELQRNSFSREKGESVLKRLKSNHSWQTPTLILRRNSLVPDIRALKNDPRLKYMPARSKSAWDKQTTDVLSGRQPEDDEYFQWPFEKDVKSSE